MADSPGGAFPAGDPRNALYFETVGKLEHSEQRGLGNLGEQRGNARANAAYRESLLSQQEPGTYKANQHRSNAGGILESGVNAERRGGIAANYANRRFAVQQGLKQTEGRIGRSEQETRERASEGMTGAGTNALVEGQKYLEEHPPAPAAAAPGGGVVAKEVQNPDGTWVRVGGPTKPRGMTVSNGLTVPTGTRTIRPYAEKRVRR